MSSKATGEAEAAETQRTAVKEPPAKKSGRPPLGKVAREETKRREERLAAFRKEH